ncbi:biotin-dependent carboxyltransferase family protein [Pseudomaricurvus sp. HS19]|uniref:5-oxoprolinase subunit C family protein n=1 Tax=Pseudomaricurvus sp. HS19 TaxID=2692626 RepID=UPI001371EC64|nr:biotin-dependent carboxyltransferase family protein [Pseudomaricurvus sp. HS19]MYM64143.1 5-oxoprolinase/urea amidolyase family protein [Pseudomaricurvus sp. HS19]
MATVEILHPGLLSLLQDSGRFGQHQIGLTSGGPLDPEAFYWANRLCDNDAATTIEASIGGLKLRVDAPIRVAVTGGEMPVTINGTSAPRWQTLRLQAGDTLELGYSKLGSRCYVAFAGGLQVEPQFGSTATVVREGIGGLRGTALQKGDTIPAVVDDGGPCLRLPPAKRPHYTHRATLRVVTGYQQDHFSREQQQRFFRSTYDVSERCDRMGYRLLGPPVHSALDGILSEGICLGAVQIPPDGQPIVLLNDRQTIGGYPKIGSVLSLDLARLAQLMPGDQVNFAEIDMELAQRILHLYYNMRRTIALDLIAPDFIVE